jgi:hypothetical protein
VQRVEFGKRLLVGQGVAAGKGPGRWTAPVAQMVLGRKLLDEPLHLRARVAGDLDQEAQQQPAFLARALGVPKLAQHPSIQLRRAAASGARKSMPAVPLRKRLICSRLNRWSACRVTINPHRMT